MPNISLGLDKRRAKSNGKFPLKIRIHYKGNTFYLPLDIDLDEIEWSQEQSVVTSIHPNAKRIELHVRKKMLELEELILTLSEDELTYFSGAQLKAYLKRKTEPQITLSQYARELISSLELMNRPGSAIAYRQALNSIERFAKRKNLDFTDINYAFLKKYEEQLLIEGKKVNTISAYLRHLRAVYNRARNEEVIPHNVYPFNKFKIKSEKTVQRQLNEKELQKLWQCNVELNEQQEFALDVFRLIFCLQGINFSDLANLTSDNIIDGRIIYKRAKTKKLYSVKITPEANDLIEKYNGQHGRFLLPILPERRYDSMKTKKLLKQRVKITNKHLGNISAKLVLSMKVTTYVARYSWANIAKRLGFSNELIAEGLGHNYGNRTTAIYLDNFDKDEVDKMNAAIVAKIASPQG